MKPSPHIPLVVSDEEVFVRVYSVLSHKATNAGMSPIGITVIRLDGGTYIPVLQSIGAHGRLVHNSIQVVDDQPTIGPEVFVKR